MTRDQVQQDAYQAWINQNSVGTIIGGTGLGKTLVGIWACKNEWRHWKDIDRTRDVKILWLTNSIRLKEVGTPEDFDKWDNKHVLEFMTMETYQSAYKWVDTKWDLVVADEGDFALTPEYSKFFDNNQYTKLMILTATSTPEKTTNYLDRLAPICFTYTTQEAQKAEILNDTRITFVKFLLSEEKTIQLKGFKQSEQGMYEYLQKKVTSSWFALNSLEADPLATKKQVDYAKKQFQWAISNRKEFLYTLQSSAKIAKQLAKRRIEQGHKVVSFSKRTEQAEKIALHTYHSKNKKDSTVIEDFNSGKIKGFGVVDAINRGENLVGLDTIILESYDSSTTSFQQRHGRGTRLDITELLDVYILLPHYIANDLEAPTQASVWAEAMVKEFDTSKAKTINL